MNPTNKNATAATVAGHLGNANYLKNVAALYNTRSLSALAGELRHAADSLHDLADGAAADVIDVGMVAAIDRTLVGIQRLLIEVRANKEGGR